MELLISRQTPLSPILTSSQLEALLTPPFMTLLRLEGVPEDAEISLLLCDDAVHPGPERRSTGAWTRPTDVLSFAQED